MAGLKLQAVTKSWDGKTQVIKPLTLDVADGEFIVMVGPSGCGKSTLLRMVAGLERVTTGDIWIDRKRVTEMEPKDRGIAMVFQNYALYPHMTVRENLAFGLKLSKLPKDQIEAQVNEAAKILELEELLDRLRLLCKGKTEPDQSLCQQFNQATDDGKNMSAYSELLSEAINSILDAKEESDIDSLFKLGGTTALLSSISGLDDFELICFLVVQ